jgi:hypothetical protein
MDEDLSFPCKDWQSAFGCRGLAIAFLPVSTLLVKAVY